VPRHPRVVFEWIGHAVAGKLRFDGRLGSARPVGPAAMADLMGPNVSAMVFVQSSTVVEMSYHPVAFAPGELRRSTQ
jgi:hypothetical protein